MTRTGMSPRLGQHIAEPYVEIHPIDAAQADLVDGGFARLATDLGQCILKVVVSERQQRGMLFAPIHWSEENSASGRVGALVAPFTDPFSGQPENKATPVAIEAFDFAQRGFVLSRKPMAFPKGVWWSRGRGDGRLWLPARQQSGAGLVENVSRSRRRGGAYCRIRGRHARRLSSRAV